MGLFTGATKIDAVYLGGGGSGSTAWIPVNLRGVHSGKATGTATFPTNYNGDLLVMYLCDSAVSTPQNPPAGWTRYDFLSSSGLGNNYYSAIYYRFSTGNVASVGITPCEWLTMVFSGVNPTTPFGAYGEIEKTTASKNNTAPAITLQQPNGNSQIIHLFNTKGNAGTWTGAAGYTAPMSDNTENKWLLVNDVRTSAPSVGSGTNNSHQSFAHSLEVLPKSNTIESGLAQAVFLGDVKVWPEYTAAQTLYNTPGNHSYVIPTGASYIDVVFIGAGGGGNGSAGGLTADGVGGRCGTWNSFSLTVGVDAQVGEVIGVNVGAGGTSGTSVAPFSAKDGAPTSVNFRSTTHTAAGGLAAVNGTIQGGTATPYVLNNRTYNGGAGGAGGVSGNAKGQNGAAPGGGGGGGFSSTTSIGGGDGGAGGCYIYAH